MAHIEIKVYTGFAGATHEDECGVPDDWAEWSEEERDKFLTETAEDAVWNCGIESVARYVED